VTDVLEPGFWLQEEDDNLLRFFRLEVEDDGIVHLQFCGEEGIVGVLSEDQVFVGKFNEGVAALLLDGVGYFIVFKEGELSNERSTSFYWMGNSSTEV
jgi:hypothetical protein